jgi:hypothetical protein
MGLLLRSHSYEKLTISAGFTAMLQLLTWLRRRQWTSYRSFTSEVAGEVHNDKQGSLSTRGEHGRWWDKRSPSCRDTHEARAGESEVALGPLPG